MIHGTLAHEEHWWRVARPGGFLDALARGMNEDVAQGVVAAPVVKLQGLPAYLERVGILEGDVGRLAPRDSRLETPSRGSLNVSIAKTH